MDTLLSVLTWTASQQGVCQTLNLLEQLVKVLGFGTIAPANFAPIPLNEAAIADLRAVFSHEKTAVQSQGGEGRAGYLPHLRAAPHNSVLRW